MAHPRTFGLAGDPESLVHSGEAADPNYPGRFRTLPGGRSCDGNVAAVCGLAHADSVKLAAQSAARSRSVIPSPRPTPVEMPYSVVHSTGWEENWHLGEARGGEKGARRVEKGGRLRRPHGGARSENEVAAGVRRRLGRTVVASTHTIGASGTISQLFRAYGRAPCPTSPVTTLGRVLRLGGTVLRAVGLSARPQDRGCAGRRRPLHRGSHRRVARSPW